MKSCIKKISLGDLLVFYTGKWTVLIVGKGYWDIESTDYGAHSRIYDNDDYSGLVSIIKAPIK